MRVLYYIEYRYGNSDEWQQDTCLNDLHEAMNYCRHQTDETGFIHRITQAWVFNP